MIMDVHGLGCLFVQGATSPPPRLTEAALIAAMEAHGIGTDATVAEHIQKQLERGYTTAKQPLIHTVYFYSIKWLSN